MEEATPDVRARSPLALLLIVALGLVLFATVAFYVWQQFSGPTPIHLVCRGLVKRFGDDDQTKLLIRRFYPPDFSAPGPGELVTLVGNERVPDTAENLCRNQLYVWETALPDSEDYKTLIECLEAAGDRDAAARCYEARVR